MKGKTDVKRHQDNWAEGKKRDHKYNTYLSSIESNLYNNELTNEAQNEFESADGSELIDKKYPAKIKALHSSSALAYNVFEYWRHRKKDSLVKAMDLNSEINSLRLEKKLNTGISTPNIDVFLKLSDGTSLSIESKFCEWMDTKNNNIKDRYFLKKGEQVSRWFDAELPNCQRLAEDIQGNKVTFKRLDAAQLLKHALGVAKSELKGSKLLYLYYDLDNASRIHKEHVKDIERFEEAVKGELNFRVMSYQDLFKAFTESGSNLDFDYLEYLRKRYFRNVA